MPAAATLTCGSTRSGTLPRPLPFPLSTEGSSQPAASFFQPRERAPLSPPINFHDGGGGQPPALFGLQPFFCRRRLRSYYSFLTGHTVLAHIVSFCVHSPTEGGRSTTGCGAQTKLTQFKISSANEMVIPCSVIFFLNKKATFLVFFMADFPGAV